MEIKTVNSNVNSKPSNVAIQSSNSDNSNSSVSYLLINNDPDNANPNYGSQLLPFAQISREIVYLASRPKIKNNLVGTVSVS